MLQCVATHDKLLCMIERLSLPRWVIAVPITGAIALGASSSGLPSGIWVPAFVVLLFTTVFAAVHHAEVVAHKVGEPFSTLILALAITVIEVALIVSLMLNGGPSTAALARDTVFAAVMLILNGILGLCLLVGKRCDTGTTSCRCRANARGSGGPARSTLSLVTGRTTILQGVVHLVILATYLFVTVVP